MYTVKRFEKNEIIAPMQLKDVKGTLQTVAPRVCYAVIDQVGKVVFNQGLEVYLHESTALQVANWYDKQTQ